MSSTWWPAAGWRRYGSGAIQNVGLAANYWSSTYSSTYYSYNLTFDYNGGVTPSSANRRSFAFSVRCVQERRNFVAKPPTTKRCFLSVIPAPVCCGAVCKPFFAGIPRLRSG